MDRSRLIGLDYKPGAAIRRDDIVIGERAQSVRNDIRFAIRYSPVPHRAQLSRWSRDFRLPFFQRKRNKDGNTKRSELLTISQYFDFKLQVLKLLSYFHYNDIRIRDREFFLLSSSKRFFFLFYDSREGRE